MEEKNKKINFSNKNQAQILVIVIVLVGIVLVGTSYAWLTVTTNSEKDVGVVAGTLNLSYDDSGSSTIELNDLVPVSDEDGLKQAAYTFKINNTGNISSDYKIYLDDVALSSGETRLNDKYVKYSLTKNGSLAVTELISTLNGKVLDSGNILTGKSNTYTLRLWLDENNFDSSATSKVFKKTIRIEGSQARTICKRATTLHSEECTQTDSSTYCSGAGYTASGSKKTSIITYGNLGTSGTLKSGDAFDCDVNGDGTFDSNTERFYYVADQDNNTAVMIYYSNTSAGVADKIKLFAYDLGKDAYKNGPVTAVAQLPTTAQWKNVSLTNTTRNLTDEKGTVRKADFSYTGYTTRLLTTQEVGTACGITVGSATNGELDSCNYLMENTKYSTSSNGTYGYWLENPNSLSTSSIPWSIFSGNRSAVIYSPCGSSPSSNCFYGVRPTIEVSKSNISY